MKKISLLIGAITLLLLSSCTQKEAQQAADVMNGEPSRNQTVVDQEDTMDEDTAEQDENENSDGDAMMEEGENSDDDVQFSVTGTNFSFSQEEIRVKKGQTVTINFESTDGFHDWVVDEFDAATQQVNPGTPTSVTFVADTAGEFEYYCSVGAHRANGMVGKLIVEDDAMINNEDTIMNDEDLMQDDASMMEASVVMEQSAQEDVMMAKSGTYTDYDTALVGGTENTVVFFHATWCPSCKAADDSISAASVPEGLTVLKADYDSETDLRKKYGVTSQHTFVQVDANGEMIKKWVGGTTVDDIVEKL